MATIPVIQDETIVPLVTAADGSVYIHESLTLRAAPFALSERFGDLESWVAYIKAHADSTNLLTWNAQGFRAKLEYETERTDRGTWEATYPFEATPQWRAWQGFANGTGHTQNQSVEFLDDHAADIVTPAATELLNLLRSLRANVNKSAASELRADGSAHITFEDERRVTSGTNQIDLPAEIEIGVPVLKGDVQPWKLVVKLRVSVGADARLALRFSVPQAEEVLETVYAERVAKAKELLGKVELLRAAD